MNSIGERRMDSSVKVLGSCRRSGELYKVRIATVNPRIMTEWEGLPGEPIFNDFLGKNGFLRKTWRGRIVIGHIRSGGWRIEQDRSVFPEFPCLEVCLFAGVLVKEVFGIKMEKIQIPDNGCRSCYRLEGKMSKKKKRGN